VNKDQEKGKAKDIAGKAQEKIGKAIGSTKQRAKGLGKQVAGKAQKAWGDAKDSAEQEEQKRDK